MKPSFEASTDVRKLVDYLRPLKYASYDDMNIRIARKLNGRDRYVLTSALRILERDDGLVFVAERGKGVRLASNGQTAALSTDHVIAKARRSIRRGKKRQALVNTQNLSAEERDAFYIGRAVIQAMDVTIGRKMRSTIAREINERGGEMIELRDIIGLFGKRAH